MIERPRCYNRPPAEEGRWHQVGRRADGRPVLRWFPRWYVDRCAAWDGDGIGALGEPYPLAHGFAGHCLTCRWRPVRRIAEAMLAAAVAREEAASV